MMAVLGLLTAVVVTWFARSLFIVFVPADRLPRWLQTALAASAPAVLGSVVALMLLSVGTSGRAVAPALLALIIATALAWRGSALVTVVLVAVGVGTLGNLWLG